MQYFAAEIAEECRFFAFSCTNITQVHASVALASMALKIFSSCQLLNDKQLHHGIMRQQHVRFGPQTHVAPDMTFVPKLTTSTRAAAGAKSEKGEAGDSRGRDFCEHGWECGTQRLSNLVVSATALRGKSERFKQRLRIL